MVLNITVAQEQCNQQHGKSGKNMNLDDYQKRARITAMYPDEHSVVYPAIGLAGEAGEVCNKIKKRLRGDKTEFNTSDISDELGDVLWYVANLASDLNLSLDAVATRNINKLRDRKERNVIQGNGDDR